MSEPKDPRHTLTIKGEQFSPEFRRKINAAAKREGLTQAEWIFLTLSRAAGFVPESAPEVTCESNGLSRLLARRSGIALKAVLSQEDVHEAVAMFLRSNGFNAISDDVAIFHTVNGGEITFTAEARNVRIMDL